MTLVQVDWKTWLVSPLLAHHPSQDPEPCRAWLRENGFSLEEEGTQFSTLFFLTNKQFRDISRAPGWAGGGYDGRIRLPVSATNAIGACTG